MLKDLYILLIKDIYKMALALEKLTKKSIEKIFKGKYQGKSKEDE